MINNYNENQGINNRLSKSFVLFIGSIFIGILIVMSLVFYKERTIFSDAAFYIFSMAEQAKPAIFHNRFMAIFSQLLPLSALKLSLPIAIVAQVYSLSFILINLIVFIISVFWEKNQRISVVVLFFSSLIISESFFAITSELTIGILVLLLIYSWVVKNQEIERRKNLIFWLIPLLVFSHALLLFPLCFLLVFFHVHYEKQFLKKDIFLVLGMFFLALVLKGLLLPDPYERSAFSGLKNFYLHFPNYFTLASNIEFLARILTHYYWIPIFLFINSVFYYKQKNWLKLLLLNGSVVLHIGFINICFPSLDTPLHYRDNLLSPIAIYLAIPFVFDLAPRCSPIFVRSIIVFVLLTASLRLMNSGAYFHERFLLLVSIYKQFQTQKIIINNSPRLEKQLIQTWATPYEFWLLSTIKDGRSASILITDSVSSMHEIGGNNSRVFLNAWGPSEYKNMPSKYFKFLDTNSVYSVVTY